jgi:hypothetical protein
MGHRQSAWRRSRVRGRAGETVWCAPPSGEGDVSLDHQYPATTTHLHRWEIVESERDRKRELLNE